MKRKTLVDCCLVAIFYAIFCTTISWLSTSAIVLRNILVPPESIGRHVDPVTGYIDSACHFLIAFLSWCAVDKISQIVCYSFENSTANSSSSTITEEGRSFIKGGNTQNNKLLMPARSAILRAFACGLLAVVIDLDHFIEAQSMSLDDFVTLTERPFLHNALIEVGFLLVFVFLYWRKSSKVNITTRRRVFITTSNLMCYVAIIIVAFTTQHNRDSKKRGFLFRLCRRNEPCASEWSTPGITYLVQIIIAFCLIFFVGIGIAQY